MFRRAFTSSLLIALQWGLVKAQSLDITPTLDEQVSSKNLPGLLFMSVPRNGTESISVTGVRKYNAEPEVEPTDVLHLGSLTKAMTATLTAKLIENGTLTWNTTVQDVFAESNFSIKAAYQNVTVQMLAAHRSGFSADTLLGDQAFFASLYNISALEGRVRYLTRALDQEPAQHASTYAYSNTNYVLLGHMIDVLVGPWEDIIQSQLFQPLGMTDCGFGPVPESSPEAIDNPWPHLLSENETPTPVPSDSDNPLFIGPAGNVHCPAASYARFLRQHLSSLTGTGNSSYLRAESWSTLHTPYDGPGQTYTSGGWVWDDDDEEGNLLWHDGSNTFNMGLTYLYPRRQVAIFGFTNVYGTRATEAIGAVFQGYLQASNGSNGDGTSNGQSGSNAAAWRLDWYAPLIGLVALSSWILL